MGTSLRNNYVSDVTESETAERKFALFSRRLLPRMSPVGPGMTAASDDSDTAPSAPASAWSHTGQTADKQQKINWKQRCQRKRPCDALTPIFPLIPHKFTLRVLPMGSHITKRGTGDYNSTCCPLDVIIFSGQQIKTMQPQKPSRFLCMSCLLSSRWINALGDSNPFPVSLNHNHKQPAWPSNTTARWLQLKPASRSKGEASERQNKAFFRRVLAQRCHRAHGRLPKKRGSTAVWPQGSWPLHRCLNP